MDISKFRPGVRHFCRVMLIEAVENRAVVEVEDNFHNFEVSLLHDGVKVTQIESRSIRYPWTGCAEAGLAVPKLLDMEISSTPQIYRYTDGLGQCTHQFEMAGLAIAQAARGPGRRVYELTVTDLGEGKSTTSIARDGEFFMEWQMLDETITASSRMEETFRGMTLKQLGRWVLEQTDADLIEAALILRRGVRQLPGLKIDMDASKTAADQVPEEFRSPGVCYVVRPGFMEKSERMQGTARYFTETAQIPLYARAMEPL